MEEQILGESGTPRNHMRDESIDIVDGVPGHL